jgi:gamma-glutamylcyclotransferase (GGCT)/AIG2-like uncharacterized protein YtfP
MQLFMALIEEGVEVKVPTNESCPGRSGFILESGFRVVLRGVRSRRMAEVGSSSAPSGTFFGMIRDFALPLAENPLSGLLFAYGTLMPDGPEAEVAGGWSADAVRGRLFDLGAFPTVVDLGDPSAEWVEGFVRPVEGLELLGRLDPYEGVAEGLFRRTVAPTRSGRLAWVYIYARPLPPDARGPLARWDGFRGALGPGLTP